MQIVIAESDARVEDDLSGREAEVMRFQVAPKGVNGWGGTDFKKYWVYSTIKLNSLLITIDE